MRGLWGGVRLKDFRRSTGLYRMYLNSSRSHLHEPSHKYVHKSFRIDRYTAAFVLNLARDNLL